MHIYVYVYIYIYAYIYIYNIHIIYIYNMYIYVYICIFIYIHTYMDIYTGGIMAVTEGDALQVFDVRKKMLDASTLVINMDKTSIKVLSLLALLVQRYKYSLLRTIKLLARTGLPLEINLYATN